MLKLTNRCCVLVALVAMLAVTPGCGLANFENVSDQAQFADLITTTYATKIPLLIHGVDMDESIGEDIDEYLVTPEPGIGGRELKARYKLRAGSVFTVKAIWECTDCYLDFAIRRKIEIELVAVDCCSGHPVYLRTVWGDMDFLVLEGEAASLSPDYFDRRTGL